MKIGIQQPAHVLNAVPSPDDFPGEFIAFLLRWIAGQVLLEMDAAKSLHRQDSRRRMLRIDTGYEDTVFVAKERADLGQNGGLGLVIRLHFQAPAQVVELVFHAFPIFTQAPRQQEEKEIAEILADGPGDAGILNLDG